MSAGNGKRTCDGGTLKCGRVNVLRQERMYRVTHEEFSLLTEVQLLSFVCSTGCKNRKSRLCNIQNLGAVPP